MAEREGLKIDYILGGSEYGAPNSVDQLGAFALSKPLSKSVAITMQSVLALASVPCVILGP